MRQRIAAAVKRSNAWRERTPARIETDIPNTPPAEWGKTLGDERLDFYEPDTDLKLADILPDLDVAHRILDHARHYLRQRLVESGCRVKSNDGG